MHLVALPNGVVSSYPAECADFDQSSTGCIEASMRLPGLRAIALRRSLLGTGTWPGWGAAELECRALRNWTDSSTGPFQRGKQSAKSSNENVECHPVLPQALSLKKGKSFSLLSPHLLAIDRHLRLELLDLAPVLPCKSSVIPIPLIVLRRHSRTERSDYDEKTTQDGLRSAQRLDVDKPENGSRDDQDVLGHRGPLHLVMPGLSSLLHV